MPYLTKYLVYNLEYSHEIAFKSRPFNQIEIKICLKYLSHKDRHKTSPFVTC